MLLSQDSQKRWKAGMTYILPALEMKKKTNSQVSHFGKHIEQDTFIIPNESGFPALDFQT